MITDENRFSFQVLFFATFLVGLIVLGYFMTMALAAYIGLVFLIIASVFVFPVLFWSLIIGGAIYGAYYIDMHHYNLF